MKMLKCEFTIAKKSPPFIQLYCIKPVALFQNEMKSFFINASEAVNCSSDISLPFSSLWVPWWGLAGVVLAGGVALTCKVKGCEAYFIA